MLQAELLLWVDVKYSYILSLILLAYYNKLTHSDDAYFVIHDTLIIYLHILLLHTHYINLPTKIGTLKIIV